MNEAEEATRKLFNALDKRLFSKQTIHEIADCIYRCDYVDALCLITEYTDMFDEQEVQLLIRSWTLIRQYHLLKLQEFERDFEKYCGKGYSGIMAQGTILCLEVTNMSLAACEKGRRKAKLIQHSRRQSQKGTEIKHISPYNQQQDPAEQQVIWSYLSQYSSSWSQTGILFLS